VIVIDASVLVPALVSGLPAGDRARARIDDEEVRAPALVDLEVLSALRGLTIAGKLSSDRAEEAVDDLRRLPIQRDTHAALVGRCWELRHNLTPYDAAYVALAEFVGCTLVTADRRIADAPGVRCEVELLTEDR
jgi:predicted nucleic acid-binding protein